MKETRQISQVAIDDIIEGCRELVFRRSQEIKSLVWSTLSESGIDPDGVSGLESVFDDEFDPFNGIETQYKQEKFFREEFGLLVSDYIVSLFRVCHLYTIPHCLRVAIQMLGR